MEATGSPAQNFAQSKPSAEPSKAVRHPVRKGPTQLPIRVTRRPPTVGARRLRPGKESASASRRTQRPRRGARGCRRLARRVSALQTLGAPRTGRLRKRVLDGAGARPEPRRTSASVRPASRTVWTSSVPEKVQQSYPCAAVRLEKHIGDRPIWWRSSAATASLELKLWLGPSFVPRPRTQSPLGAGDGRKRAHSALRNTSGAANQV